MIGLGVGIDYALFIVTRHKLQLKDDMEMGSRSRGQPQRQAERCSSRAARS